MNYIADKTRVCKFPSEISFESVPGYLNTFVFNPEYSKIIFDLSETETFHSSFAGFLIYVKSQVEKNNAVFDIRFSENSARIMHLMKLYEYFCGSRKTNFKEKTA